MSNNKQFTITLTERQLKLLAYACRVTDRRHPLRGCKRSWSMLYGWRKTRKSGQTGPTTLLSTQALSQHG